MRNDLLSYAPQITTNAFITKKTPRKEMLQHQSSFMFEILKQGNKPVRSFYSFDCKRIMS